VDVFVSVGTPATPEQENFIQAFEKRLISEGLNPRTAGRNEISIDRPIVNIERLMDRCHGVAIIALERVVINEGFEKPGSPFEKALKDVRLPTPWNHIEAALGYSRDLPLMVIVEEGLRNEGFLEPGNDWYVLNIPMSVDALNSQVFNGLLSDWKSRLKGEVKKIHASDKLTVAQIFSSLTVSGISSLLAIFAIIAATSFAIGAEFFR
jgi:hypothetical protein